jgi:hypothetical protein
MGPTAPVRAHTSPRGEPHGRRRCACRWGVPLGEYALSDWAREQGYAAMQFNSRRGIEPHRPCDFGDRSLIHIIGPFPRLSSTALRLGVA